MFSPNEVLITYGSLVPGGMHHDLVSELTGEWVKGTITARRLPDDWRPGFGYPAIEWLADLPPFQVDVFLSKDLPGQWSRLDAFEGPDYARLGVPVTIDKEQLRGYVYAAREHINTSLLTGAGVEIIRYDV